MPSVQEATDKAQCDVKQPSCANCDKKSLDCSFLLLAPQSRLSLISPTSSKTSLRSLASTPPLPKSSTTPTASTPRLTPSPFGSPDSDNSAFSGTIYFAETSDVHDDLPSSFQVTTLSPSRRAYYPECSFSQTTIPPSLWFEDTWKDVRDCLPPSLQEVLQHYEYTTSLTLATDDPAKAAWQACIPEMARRHDFLVNCVLAVASLHLGRLHDSPSQKKRMNAIAAARMNKALASYRPQLEHVTQHNAAALFAGVTLTAVYLFRTSALDIEHLRASIPPGTIEPPPDIAEKMLACAVRTIHGLRGPLAVLLSGWAWVTGGGMQSVAQRKWWPKTCVPATPRAMTEDELLAQLANLWAGELWEPRKEYLDQALQGLRDTFGLVSLLTLPERFPPMTAVSYSVDDTTVGTLTDRGAIFVWATIVSREYLQLVEARDRDALVVLAHYAVLPGRVRNVWWLEGLGADIVTAIAMVLGKDDWGLIEWPASVVGVDLANLMGVRKDRLEGQIEELGMQVI